MTRTIVWSADAAADIVQVVDHLAETDLAFAERLVDELRATANALGQHDTGRPGRMSGTREKSLTRFGYILSYHVSGRDNGQITILRVIHSRQKWQKGRWPKPSSR